MNAIIDWALKRDRLVIAALICILLAGAIAWREIAKEAEPDVRIPIIYVQMRHDGISPEDSERLLIRPMEQELRRVEGIKEMRSSAYEGGGFVLLEFEAGFDSDRAVRQVRERVDRVRPELPAETREPTVNEVNLSLFPVLVVTLSGELPERTFLRLGRRLRERIEQLPSILEARIVGTREELVEIIVDPLRAESYGLSPNVILQRVAGANQVIAAGALESGRGRFSVQVPGLFNSLADLLDLPLTAANDRVVRVREVAEVRRAFRDREASARIDGRPAVAIEVSKRTGENIIDTIAAVRRVVEEESRDWPEGVRVGFIQDKSDNIRGMLSDLENNLAIAALLVLILVLASLGWRTTTLVAVAVPGSFLAGILMLAGMGLTINIVVLFGLIFAAGNVVDGAIVVTEYADSRMAEGMDRSEAYQLAAKRMAWPIIASTATQLAAFLPLLFWPGVVGQFMRYMPISQFVTMAAALAMALIFVPALGAKFGRSGGGTEQSDAVIAIRESRLRDMRGGTGLYVRFLAFTLDRPATTLLVAVAMLGLVAVLYGRFGAGVEFFPRVEPDRAAVLVHARGNLSVGERDHLVRGVEDRILAIGRARGEFASVYARVGSQPGQAQQQNLPEDTIGSVQIEFGPWQSRRRADDILAEIRAATADLAGIEVETRREEAGPPVGKPVQVEIAARDPALLGPAAARVARHLAENPLLRDIEDTRPLPGIQWRLEVDRAQAAMFGLDIAQVGQMVRLVTNGLKLSTWRPADSDEEIDIVVRYPIEWRNLAQLDAIRIGTTQGLVPLSNFVRRVPEPQTGLLNRVDQRRVMQVRADVQPGVNAAAQTAAIESWLASERWPDGVELRVRGQDEESRRASAFLQKAFLGAIALIFLILLAQFNSFYYTLVILSAVVMSVFGVLIGLLIAGQPFGIVMSGIGVVALAGIVVANNIVLIDTFVHERAGGLDTRSAILVTGASRLRPVILTAINNVLGLMPMCFGINVVALERTIEIGAPSSQWWIQLSQAIVYGLGFATILTLVLTPCALMLRQDLSDGIARLRAWRPRRRRPIVPEANPRPAE